jgi:hypothetical protein
MNIIKITKSNNSNCGINSVIELTIKTKKILDIIKSSIALRLIVKRPEAFSTAISAVTGWASLARNRARVNLLSAGKPASKQRLQRSNFSTGRSERIVMLLCGIVLNARACWNLCTKHVAKVMGNLGGQAEAVNCIGKSYLKSVRLIFSWLGKWYVLRISASWERKWVTQEY